MRENYTNTAFQLYDIQRLADLYHAVDGLISPMSTVLLESLLFEVPILAVAFSHGKHDWSADKFSQSTHFQEFLQMEGVLITRDANTWINDVRRLIERSNDSEGGKRLKEASKRFVHHSQTDTYAQRLWHVMKRMLSEHRVQYDSATLRRLRMVNQVKQRWNSPRLKPIRQFSMKLQRRIPILKNRVAPHLIDV
jgi:CDP-glycerol glycerophosphotransferase (TagB/SpsB family)